MQATEKVGSVLICLVALISVFGSERKWVERQFVESVVAFGGQQQWETSVTNTKKFINHSTSGNPDRSGSGSAGRLVGGCLAFVLGFALLKFSFYVADAPYGTHTWRSRLIYIGCGLCALICIWQGVSLVLGFIVTRKHLQSHYLSYYNNCVANILSTDKQIAVIAACVTVLHIPPVVLPQTAVQAAIVQEVREHGEAN